MARVIHGDTGGNQLNVSADKTQAYGLSGNDTIISDNKRDALLIGGTGDDSLVMFGGNGTLNGGKGSDTFELTYSATKSLSAVIEDFVPTEDKIVVNFDGDTAPQLTSEVKGNDVVLKDSDGLLNVTLKGVRENDYFDGNASEQVWEVLELTNAEREAQGLSALTLSEGLMQGASIRADEITGLGQTGALSNHTRPDGKGEWYTVLEGKYNYPGENIDGGASSAQAVMDDWMNSKSHKKNIVDERFNKIGIGYNEEDSDTSNLRFYWTQEFADSLKSIETVDISTATIETHTVSKSLELTDNTYNNTDYGATICGTSSADSITNAGAIVSINSGNGKDTIENNGANVTINAGIGDDIISLSADSKGNVIEYVASDGNVTVYGFNDTDTLKVYNEDYPHAYIIDGNDFVLESGDNSIRLVDAAKFFINIHELNKKYIVFSANDDSIENWYDSDVIIYANDGDDSITNHNTIVVITGGSGNDYIYQKRATKAPCFSYGDEVVQIFP